MTTEITYAGPYADGVELENGQLARPGETIEVDDDLATNLLEQGTWVSAGDPVGGAGTVSAVLAEVGDDLEKAAAALTVERAQDKPRTTLIDKLEAIVASGEEG